MDNNFHECLVTKKSSGGDTAKKIAIYVAGVLLACACIVFLFGFFPFNLLFGGLIMYGAIYLSGNFNYEYEYIFTDGEMDIDKIIGKRKRKRLVTAKVELFERYGRIEDAPAVSSDYTTVQATDNSGEGSYFADFKHPSFGNVRIIFTPDEGICNCIEASLPSLLRAELRRSKMLAK